MIPLEIIIPTSLVMLLIAGLIGRVMLRGGSSRLWVLLVLGMAALGALVWTGVNRAGKPTNQILQSVVNQRNTRALEASIERERHSAGLVFGLMGAGVLLALSTAISGYLASSNAKHRRLNATLTADRDRLERLVNSIDSIVWEFDANDLRFTFVNKQSGRILGYEAEKWLANPGFRESILHPEDRWAMGHCRQMIQRRKPYEFDYRVIASDGRTVWVRESGRILTGANGVPTTVRGTLQDVTALKEVDVEMKRLNESVMEASRHAGMAEVATTVLHNVGNLLNSISVSATVASDHMKCSKAGNLRQAVQMMRGRADDLAEFLTVDPKGRLIPEYLDNVTEQLSNEQATVINEMKALNENIEHVKGIVAMQQDYASSSGVFEFLHPSDLADDALRMNAGDLQRTRVRYTREYGIMPPKVQVDRHKVLQILVNIIQNAMHAMDAARVADKHLIVSVKTVNDGEMVAISVRDNGVGIASEHLTEIFRHGFTTKQNGHGFGLHGAANFAKELGGSLSVHSAGSGLGAEFTLLLPTQQNQETTLNLPDNTPLTNTKPCPPSPPKLPSAIASRAYPRPTASSSWMTTPPSTAISPKSSALPA